MNIKAVKKYLTKNKIDVQNANASLSVASSAYYSYANSSVIHGIDFSPVFFFYIYTERQHHFQLVNENIINKLAKKIYFNYLADRRSLDQIIKNHLASTAKMDRVWHDYQCHRTNLSSGIIFSYLKKFLAVSQIFWYYSSIGEDKGNVIELEIVPVFAERHNFSLNRSREIFSVLSQPKELSFLNLERKEFLEICLNFLSDKRILSLLRSSKFDEIRQIKKFRTAIGNYLSHNFWVKSDFYRAKHLSFSSVLKEIKKEILVKNRDKIIKELHSITLINRSVREKQRRILKSIKLSGPDRTDIYFAKRTIYWIDQRKLGSCKFFYYYSSFLEDIGKLFRIDYDELSLYDFFDILKLLEQKKIKKSILSQRRKNYLAVFQKNKAIQYFYGQEPIKIFYSVTRPASNKIKGTVACSGRKKIIYGIARIISNPLKDKFKKNEILVTSMTRIEFVPLMRKAAAVVTNEGGIASHAAIVSRELNIPCIVGTKIATKVLKDGDKVKIDTTQGVVRKL